MAAQANFRQRQTIGRFPGIPATRPVAAPQPPSQTAEQLSAQDPPAEGSPNTNGKHASSPQNLESPRPVIRDEDGGQSSAEQPSTSSQASLEEADAVQEVERGLNGAQSPSDAGRIVALHSNKLQDLALKRIMLFVFALHGVWQLTSRCFMCNHSAAHGMSDLSWQYSQTILRQHGRLTAMVGLYLMSRTTVSIPQGHSARLPACLQGNNKFLDLRP